MASVHKQNGSRPGYKLRFRDVRGRQCVLWIGDVSKRNAESISRHVCELVRAIGAGIPPEMESAKWANELTGRIRQRLAEWGLVGAERRVGTTDEVRLCGAFFEAYITGRSDLKAITQNKYRQAAGYFVKFVGKTRLLADVTPADIDAWRLWMVSQGRSKATADTPARGLAVATANKHAKIIKKLFAQAVRSRLISENPAADQKIGMEVNRARDFYVDQTLASRVLNQCRKDGETEWALIFGLCRFAGFRCPTEVLALTWSDVDWECHRLRIDSVKTGLRYCPIYPELRSLLEAAFNEAPEGSLYCIRRYRGSEANLRTQFIRILARAGIVQWPKLFVNLRASCRTDLQEKFPDHVINSWLGHSGRIAERHYLQTTDAHWERAIKDDSSTLTFGGNAGGNISANQGPLSSHHETKKPSKKLGSDGCGLPLIAMPVPPQGLEPWTR